MHKALLLRPTLLEFTLALVLVVDLQFALDFPLALNLDVPLALKVALDLDVQVARATDLTLVLTVVMGVAIAEANTAVIEDRSLRPIQITAFLSVFK